MSSEVTWTWAGSPSRIATREGPWDSPAVSQRSMGAVFHAWYDVLGRSPGDEMPPQRCPEHDPGQRAGEQERPERQRGAQRRPVPPCRRQQDTEHGEDEERGKQLDQQL